MLQSKESKWFLYGLLVLSAVGSRLLLLRITPPTGVSMASALWIALKLLPFVVLFWIVRDDKRIPHLRWALFFALFIAIVLLVDPFAPQFWPSLENNQIIARVVERVLLAAGGWQFPLFCMVIFVLIFLFQRKRTGGSGDRP